MVQLQLLLADQQKPSGFSSYDGSTVYLGPQVRHVRICFQILCNFVFSLQTITDMSSYV